MLLTLRTRIGLSAIAGLSMALSVVFGPVPALMLGAFPFWLAAIDERPLFGHGIARPQERRLRDRDIFVIGWAAGVTCNALALYWIAGLLVSFAHFPLPLAMLVAALLFLAQGTLLGILALFVRKLAYSGGSFRLAYAFGAALLFAYYPNLFPWRPSTGAVGALEWAQTADLGGAPLVDFIFCFVAASVYEGLRGDRRAMWHGALAFGLTLFYGDVRIQEIESARIAAPTIRIGVVQPNISIEDKHDASKAESNIRRLHADTMALEREGADLIAWPETAFPFRLHHDIVGSRHDGSVLPRGLRTPVLVGALTQGREPCDRFNSVIAFDDVGRATGIVDKIELIPFSEQIPFWHVLPPLQHFFRCPGFQPGEAPTPLLVRGVRVGILNCYEDVIERATRDAALRQPDVLINVTNDAWFGDTREPHLHQLVARTRAIEVRRDLVRSVNTGVSSHISATGESLAETATFAPAREVYSAASLSGRTVWTQFGDWVSLLAYAYLSALIVLAFRDRKRRAIDPRPRVR